MWVAQGQPGTAQITERDRLAVAVADLAGDGQRLGEQVDRLRVLAQAEAAEVPRSRAAQMMPSPDLQVSCRSWPVNDQARR